MASTAVCERTQFYVYVLRRSVAVCPPSAAPAACGDPRDRSMFYVGKGTGNRVFEHVAEAIEGPMTPDKLDRIRAIHAAVVDGGCFSAAS